VTAPVVILAGGGTGGHVLPIVAVAEALVAKGVGESEITFIASARGPDRTLLDPLPFHATYVSGRGIQRSLRPNALRDNVAAAAGLVRAVGRIFVSFIRRRPNVVVSAGGYAAFPAVLSAKLLAIPLVLINIDAVPGAVHRLFGRRAVASCVGFAGTDLPNPIVTGAPLSTAITTAKRSPEARTQARHHFGLGSGRVVGVVGGSLGARSINRATVAMVRGGLGDIEVYHVAGRRDFEVIAQERRALGSPLNYHLVPFEREMAQLYVAADVIVARAGAMTVAELAAVGVPAILVPLPGAPGDHQTKNAEALVRAGGAMLVDDASCTGERLSELLAALSDEQLATMAAKSATLHTPDAAAMIAAVVLRYVG
jgi:UDP-N-acetylglucosamine--N-acetylmuramyl-(pentapeptide) pyrophosphoryl-undecaprenol N-acetylglucosamine transferase